METIYDAIKRRASGCNLMINVGPGPSGDFGVFFPETSHSVSLRNITTIPTLRGFTGTLPLSLIQPLDYQALEMPFTYALNVDSGEDPLPISSEESLPSQPPRGSNARVYSPPSPDSSNDRSIVEVLMSLSLFAAGTAIIVTIASYRSKNT